MLAVAALGGTPAAGTAAGAGEDRVTLAGNVHPLARHENDAGPAGPGLPMGRILMVLRRRPGAEAGLRRFLDTQ